MERHPRVCPTAILFADVKEVAGPGYFRRELNALPPFLARAGEQFGDVIRRTHFRQAMAVRTGKMVSLR